MRLRNIPEADETFRSRKSGKGDGERFSGMITLCILKWEWEKDSS